MDGLKISGTAAYSNRSRKLFNGTLLFDTDFAMMRNALNGERSLRCRKIASGPSPTANISGMLARRYADASDFMDGLACFFRDYYKAEELYVCRTVAG